MPITLGLDEPFFVGGTLSPLVPSLFPVAIDGRPYLVDLKSGAFQRRSIPMLRSQADTSNLPGASSINPEDLWRREQESWHHGAGQQMLDRQESDPTRFWRSKGVDVWEKWQLSLLPAAERKTPTSTNVNQNLTTAGDWLFWADGATLRKTQDATPAAPTFSAITGLGTNAIESLASDGYYVYAAQGSQGVYRLARTDTAATNYVTGTARLVGYVKGRVMVAAGAALYNVTASGALPAALYTHPNPDFAWVGFAEGTNVIYAAGYSGDKSLIYRTAVRPDGTGLDVPVVAGELPDGEIVRAIQGYLGFVVIGTDEGVRFATADAQGNLTLGSLISIDQPVRCFEGQDRFVWFGWSNFDADTTGLGRLDLSTFIAPLTPAYATDLQGAAQGAVTAVTTFKGRRYWTVQQNGLWGQSGDLVAEGWLESGRVTYGIPDPKVSMFLQVRHRPLVGSVELSLQADDGDWVALGVGTTAGSTSTEMPTNQAQGEQFNIRTTLVRGAVLTTGPTITRHTLKAQPAPSRGEIFIVPLLLHEILNVDSQERPLNPAVELEAVRQMVEDRRLVTYQEATTSRTVFVEDYEWNPYSETMDGKFWNGTLVVKLKAVGQ